MHAIMRFVLRLFNHQESRSLWLSWFSGYFHDSLRPSARIDGATLCAAHLTRPAPASWQLKSWLLKRTPCATSCGRTCKRNTSWMDGMIGNDMMGHVYHVFPFQHLLFHGSVSSRVNKRYWLDLIFLPWDLFTSPPNRAKETLLEAVVWPGAIWNLLSKQSLKVFKYRDLRNMQCMACSIVICNTW